MQLFTKQASQWRERGCEDAEVTAFAAAVLEAGVLAVSAHDSYLINLASPKDDLRARSLDSFVRELQRCDALGIPLLVSHPGNYMDDRESGIARNADSITAALERAPCTVTVLLETTAGSGTALGATFEELWQIIRRVPSHLQSRLGVCLDTCHVHAAGYDIVSDYDGVMQHLDDVLGMQVLGMLHLNDSKTPLGSRRDRHELIAEGSLGEAPFRRIMTDDRLVDVPKVLETPKLDDAEATDRRMVSRLRGYADETTDTEARDRIPEQ